MADKSGPAGTESVSVHHNVLSPRRPITSRAILTNARGQNLDVADTAPITNLSPRGLISSRVLLCTGRGQNLDVADNAPTTDVPPRGLGTSRVLLSIGSSLGGSSSSAYTALNSGFPSTNFFFKTKVCKGYPEECPKRADECQFAHGEMDLRAEGPKPDRLLYKTKVCRYVLSGKKCYYGARCWFKHPKERCDKYHICRLHKLTKKCMFGDICPQAHK